MKCSGIELIELSREVLGRGNCFRFRAQGGSMHPFIRDGDILEIAPPREESIGPGDVVFYRAEGERALAHRVIGKNSSNGKTTLVTKGDSSPACEKGIALEDILGKVVAIERDGRKIRINRGLNKLVNISYARVSHLSPYIYPLIGKIRRGLRYLLAGSLRGVQGLKVYRRYAKKLIKDTINFSIAVPDDAFSLSRFYRYNRQPDSPVSPQSLREQLDPSQYPGYILLAKSKDEIAGVVSVGRPREDLSDWWISDMSVNWRCRGRGIGERLLKIACALAARDGASCVKLLVFKKSKPAIELYKKMNFSQVSIPDIEERLGREAEKGLGERIILAKYLSPERKSNVCRSPDTN